MGGLQINLIIGIDFTCSNNPTYDPNSLHYLKTETAYEKAIKACGNIVAFYDYDQLFPVFGYGAILPNEKLVNHCFPINFSDNPSIYTIDNIIPVYRNCLSLIKMHGPTCFAPIIRKTIKYAEETKGNNNVYYILMILTDGQINDMPETEDAIVDASFLPISFIIIGIGTGNFDNMDILDADTNPLFSSKGVKAARDCVQFVEFNSIQNDPVSLASKVLEEIPFQVEEYYSRNNIPPCDPIN